MMIIIRTLSVPQSSAPRRLGPAADRSLNSRDASARVKRSNVGVTIRPTVRPSAWFLAICVLGLTAARPALGVGKDSTPPEAPPAIDLQRLPSGGVQPQLRAEGNTLHLVYLSGKPAAADVWYRVSRDGGKSWSAPLRVNSQDGSAVAIGGVRGAQLAVDAEGRPHVVWNGSQTAEPRTGPRQTPLLYSRLADDAKSFEPQRNIIAQHFGLDGGCSVAADGQGRVFIGWHAPHQSGQSEQDRAVWVAASRDHGKTFAPEVRFSPSHTGACGCCGLTLLASGKTLSVVYRTADRAVHRDMVRLRGTLDDSGRWTVQEETICPTEVAICLMSTSALAADRQGGGVAAVEDDKSIVLMRMGFGDKALPSQDRANVVGQTGRPRHPAIALNGDHRLLLAWADGAEFNRGGRLMWTVVESTGRMNRSFPQPPAGKAANLPTWSFPAVAALPDGKFVIVY